MADVIQVRRDTAANWTAANPTLANGEPGYETDTSKMKVGDGSTAWTLLSYFAGSGGTTFQDYIGSPMVVTGGEVSTGTNAGTFKVAALTALLRTTDLDIGTLVYVTKTEEDNIAIPLTDTLYYVVLNYNSGSPTISLITGLQDFTDNIPLGSVSKNASNEVNYISGCYRLQDGVAKLHYRAFELYGLYLTSGNTLAYSGTNNFTMTSGVIYEGINRLTQAAYDSAVVAFDYIHQDGVGGWTETPSNVIDYAHYDDGDGTLGDVGVSKYGCHWIYRHIDTGDIYVLYGRGSYSLAEAEVTDIPSGPDHLTNFGCLIGRIIAPQAGGSFSSVQMVTDTIFTGQSVATHNDLGGIQGGAMNDYYHLTSADVGKLDNLPSMNRTAVGAADYNPSILTTDYIIAVDNTAAPRAVIISTEDVGSGTAANTRVMHIVDESGNASTNNITITLENGGTISGNLSVVINGDYNTISIYLTGTNGFIH